MKRFRFRLDRVLALRVAAEKEEGRLLGEAARLEEAQRRAADAGAARHRAAEQQVAGQHDQPQAAGTFINLGHALGQVAAESAAQTELHRAALARFDTLRERYDAARVRRRILERLRDQRHAAWRTEAAREEQRVIDEAALGTRPEGQRP
jgi:flagellar export protein FliJ